MDNGRFNMIPSSPDGFPGFLRAKIDRPTWVEVDAQAIQANIRSLRRPLDPRVRFMAVVKAEAYGHGALGVATSALGAGADCFGVATPYEGQLLRAAKIDSPIIILSPTLPVQAPAIVENRLVPSITSLETARAIAQLAPAGDPVPVHVKVNTGMNRSGVEREDAVEFLRALRAVDGIEIEGIFSHFYGADDPDRAPAYAQFEKFDALLRELRTLGLRPPIAHISNSAAIIDMPEMSLDMVRAGLAIYGMYPSDFVSRRIKLAPALVWKSRVVETRRIEAGEPVSYSATWIAERSTTVALMPVGYADGFRRALSNRGEVLIRGRRCRVAGRVCMDLTVLDCGDEPVEIGDEIVLIGRQGDDEISAERMAETLGTNNYEVTTQITYRVSRRLAAAHENQ
jgi:alanine racemase